MREKIFLQLQLRNGTGCNESGGKEKGMRTNLGIRKKNPFRISFLGITVICCVALSIVFYYISYLNDKATQESYARDKTELILSDFETQLKLMEDVSYRIASNYEFHPFYFKKNIARELSMLETFKQYRYYTALTEEYFLYYGGDRVFRSSGSTFDYELFLQLKSEDEEEQQKLRDELTEMREELTEIRGELKILSISQNIYVLIPLKVSGGEQQIKAVLGFVVKKSTLGERFQVVSGSLKGGITLYGEDGILYSNQEQPVSAEQKSVVNTVSLNELYTICYLPEKSSMNNGLFVLQLILVLTDMFLVFIIANIFAERAYKPLQILTDKYRGKTAWKEEKYENALEELNFLMDSMHQSNVEADSQIQKKQKMIRNQILQMLMEGSGSFDTPAYLDKDDIHLPGPFFCVISISFEDEEAVTKDFLTRLLEELEQIPEDKDYIYAICNYKKKLVNVICNIRSEEGKDELIETVCDVAESFTYVPIIGIGNTYQTLNNLSASWLESMDDIHSKKKQQRNEKQQGFIYDSEELHRISAALESGNEEAAMEKLDCYVKKLRESPMSLLMQQYIMADFLGEVRKLSEKYQMELSKQNLSLLISAKNIQSFETAAKNVIHDFCEGYEGIRNQMKDVESKRICEYIEEHFAEYDISIENVAANLHTGTAAVRQAVLKHTGKRYKDYLIYLRIEYAKVLLRQEELSVAELCQKVGYGNVSHFIKLFREITGVTPAKYRRDIVDK